MIRVWLSLVLVAFLGGESNSAFAQSQLRVKEKSSVKGGPPKGALVDDGFHRFATAFSPDGKMLASGNGYELNLYDATTGTKLTSKMNSLTVSALAFSPDGATLAVGLGTPLVNGRTQQNPSDGIVVLWDTNTRKQAGVLRVMNVIYSLAFSPDGETLAVGLSGAVSLWDVRKRTERAFLRSGVSPLAYSPDGKFLGGVGSSVFDTETEELWKSPDGKVIYLYLHGIGRSAFSPDSKLLASTWTPLTSAANPAPPAIKFWDMKTGKEKLHADHVRSSGWNSVGQRTSG